MKVVIYTKNNCPFCVRAKEFFSTRNINFTELKIGRDITTEEYKANIFVTAPGIFVDDNFIGGYDDLVWLNSIKPELFNVAD